MEEKTKEQIITELEETNKSILFLTDQIRFNSVVYEALSTIIERLTKIEEQLKWKNQTS